MIVAIVGAPWSQLPVSSIVEVDESRSVSYLKQKIKEANPYTLKAVELSQLQLYLAKKNNTWLTKVDVRNGMSVIGLKRLGSAGESLDSVGLSVEVVRKEAVQVENTVVHVLVVIQQRKPLPPQIFPTFHPYIDGLDVRLPHLPRAALVEKLYRAVLATNVVLISSPPYSGKTALLTLFHQRYRDEMKCVAISLNATDPASQILGQYGIDVSKKKCLLSADSGETVVMLDDADSHLNDKAFWTSLVGGLSSWIPPNVRFVISTRYSIESEWTDCPVEFKSFEKKIMRNDFLLNDDEAHELVAMESIGLPSRMRTSTVDHVIIRECAGHIGALRRVIDLVAKYFVEETSPQEHEVLAFCLSMQLVQTMGGLFEGGRVSTLSSSSELRDFLIKCFLNQPDTVPPPMEGEDLRCFTLLIEEGVIVQDTDSVVTFTSPLAGRRYVKYLYPNRLDNW